MLKGTCIGNALTDTQLETLASEAELKIIQPGRAIVSPRDTSFPLMVLISGTAEVVSRGGGAINVVEAGGLIGELAFLDRKGRSATVLARDTCRLAVLAEDVASWMESESADILVPLFYNVAMELCAKLRSVQRMVDASAPSSNPFDPWLFGASG